MGKETKPVKLIYDFDTSKCTEVEVNNVWYRVTCNNFRSFNGPRRIMLINDKREIYYQEYDGPIYLYGTNSKLKDYTQKGIVTPLGFERVSKMRPGEQNYLLDKEVKTQLNFK